MRFEDYAMNINPLPEEDGGGFMVEFPDLPGCIADGETIEQAVREARDAFNAWAAAEIEDKGRMPEPKQYSGQFVQRIPKSLHKRLAVRAKTEGISLNQYAACLLAEGVGMAIHSVKK